MSARKIAVFLARRGDAVGARSAGITDPVRA